MFVTGLIPWSIKADVLTTKISMRHSGGTGTRKSPYNGTIGLPTPTGA